MQSVSLYLIYEHCAFPAASQSCRKIPRETRPPSPLERNAPSQKHRQTARASPIFFSDQYKIRFPVTKNPPSRNRKPRFASPQKQSTAPSLGVRPYVPYRLRRSLRRYICFLCSLCSYVPALSGKHERHILCPYVLLFLCLPR